MKNDPRYVKWIFRLAGKRKGVDFERILPHYKCTDEDYKQFYPVQKRSKIELETIKADPKRGFNCINWDEDEPIELIGDYGDDDYSRIEILFVPCNYLHTMGNY